jgi:hypothetical protein
MRSDLILAHKSAEVAYQTEWWTNIEFDAVTIIVKNFPFDPSDPEGFHARTTLLGKTSNEVMAFAQGFLSLIHKRQKGVLMLPKSLHKIQQAPEVLRKVKSFTPWTQSIRACECDEVIERMELVRRVQAKVEMVENGTGGFPTKSFLEALVKFGIDAAQDLMLDERFAFRKCLSGGDVHVLRGRKARRNLAECTVPDFVFNEMDLADFVSTADEVPEVKFGKAKEERNPKRPKNLDRPKKRKGKRLPEPDTTVPRRSPRSAGSLDSSSVTP